MRGADGYGRHIALCLMVVLSGMSLTGAVEIQSPNGRLVVSFAVQDFEGAQACPIYRVRYQGQVVVADSKLGLRLQRGDLGEGVTAAVLYRSTENGARFAIATMRSRFS